MTDFNRPRFPLTSSPSPALGRGELMLAIAGCLGSVRKKWPAVARWLPLFPADTFLRVLDDITQFMNLVADLVGQREVA